MYNQESNHILQEMLNERYQLQKVLSQKAGRQTFLAYDLQTEELVVVKILKFGSDFESLGGTFPAPWGVKCRDE